MRKQDATGYGNGGIAGRMACLVLLVGWLQGTHAQDFFEGEQLKTWVLPIENWDMLVDEGSGMGFVPSPADMDVNDIVSAKVLIYSDSKPTREVEVFNLVRLPGHQQNKKGGGGFKFTHFPATQETHFNITRGPGNDNFFTFNFPVGFPLGGTDARAFRSAGLRGRILVEYLK